MLSRSTKCIEELSFYQPPHATIIKWLTDAIKGMLFDITECPPVREGDSWPIRPLGRSSGYFAVVTSAISREWSLAVSSVRPRTWTVVGSEVMVRRYERFNTRVRVCEEAAFLVILII